MMVSALAHAARERPSITIRNRSFMLRSKASVVLRCVLAVASGLSLSGCDKSTSDRLDRWGAGFFFAASEKNAAFPVQFTEGTAIIFVDLATGGLQKLVSSKANIFAPYLSPDGTKLLIVRRLHNSKEFELISCETRLFDCKQVFKSANRLDSPIEISNNRILYIASPYMVGGDGRGRYAKNDIWSIDAEGKQRQLTSMELYQLDSLSVGKSEIYFNGYGSPRKNPVIPRAEPLAKNQSEMFKLPFDETTGDIAAPQGILKPLFPNGGIAIRPSVGPDGFPFAFLQTRTDIGNYKYNVVLLDPDRWTSRVFETSGTGFSRPVVVGDKVIANDIGHSSRVIRMFTPGKIESQTLATIDDASISKLEAKELKIKP